LLVGALSTRDDYPRDAWLIEIPQNSKAARDDYRTSAVRAADFLGLAGNVGMRLDGQYLLVDIDAPNAEEAQFLARRLDREAPTRKVHTPRGGSHRIYLLPPNWRGGNAKMRSPDGAPYADLKTLGYALGPGSSVGGRAYTLVDPREPIPAPSWLLELCAQGDRDRERDAVAGERSGIPRGEHDDALVGLAGYLRGRLGLDEAAIARTLAGAVDSGLLENQDEARGTYGPQDFARIARGARKWEPGRDALAGITLDATTWRSGAETRFVGEPTRWFMRGFVPRGELVTLYGAGGSGKSTFGGWLTALATSKGASVGVALVEEPFTRFLARAVLSGANRSMVYEIPNAGSLRFPRDAQKLEAAVAESGIGLLIFDAIYAHFDLSVQGNAAERARAVMGPLAEMAQRTGCAVLAVYHEAKDGSALGSAEMSNVGRVNIHATRRPGGPMRLRVRKTNFEEPECRAQFEAERVPIVEADGEVQREEDASGALVPATIAVARRLPDTDEMEDAPVDADGMLDVEAVAKKRTRKKKAVEY
jgi:hypothetical protein